MFLLHVLPIAGASVAEHCAPPRQKTSPPNHFRRSEVGGGTKTTLY